MRAALRVLRTHLGRWKSAPWCSREIPSADLSGRWMDRSRGRTTGIASRLIHEHRTKGICVDNRTWHSPYIASASQLVAVRQGWHIGPVRRSSACIARAEVTRVTCPRCHLVSPWVTSHGQLRRLAGVWTGQQDPSQCLGVGIVTSGENINRSSSTDYTTAI